MEPITDLIKTSVPTEQNAITPSPLTYESASQSEIERYLEALYLIVTDSYNLSSQMPTAEEKATRSESWARSLMGIVPESELQRAFDRAFADHSSNFPISAYDIKDAHERILDDARTAAAKEQAEFMRKMEAERRLKDGFQCRHCFGCGWREVPDPTGAPYRGVVRCNECNYWHFYRQNREASS